MADRPLLVALIGGITLLMAFVVLAISIISIVDPSLLNFIDADISKYVGYGGLILGIIYLIIGGAIWSGWSIAWYIAVILYGIATIGSLVSLIMGNIPMIVTPVISLVILYYLFRPKVKEFYGI